MPFSYQIRRSQRAQRARIVVSPSKVEIVVPLRMTESVIHGFVQNKQSWIIRTMEKLKHREQTLESFAPIKYVQDAKIPFRGDKFPLTVGSTRLKKRAITGHKHLYYTAISVMVRHHEQHGQQSTCR